MKDTILKLKVVQKGTHFVAIDKINNDIPSPCEVVADCLADLEYHIKELIKAGGSEGNSVQSSAVYFQAKGSLLNLNDALQYATKQNWKLDLEEPFTPNQNAAPPVDMNSSLPTGMGKG